MDRDIFDAIVIGAGVTGLTCAYTLLKSGKKCLLIEKDSVGGLLKTRNISQFQCEQGPNVFVNKLNVKEFLSEIGLQDQFVEPTTQNSGKYVWCQNKICKAPTNPLAFLRTPLIPDSDKLMLFRLFRALVSKKMMRPANDDESVAKFFGKIFSKRTIERLLDPVLKGIYGGDVYSLSARSLFPTLWQALNDGKNILEYMKEKPKRGGMFVLRGGSESIITALKKQLHDVEFIHDCVADISENDTGYLVTTTKGDSFFAKNVFVATSGEATSSFIKGIDQELALELQKINYTSLVVVNVAVEDEVQPNAFGVLFPAGIQSHLLGVMYNSELFPHKAPTGKQLITMMFGGVHTWQDLRSHDEAYWRRVAKDELASRFNFKSVEVLCVTPHQYAIPQYELNHYKLEASLRACEERHKGLYFIGADTGGIAVPDRIYLAQKAVTMCINA